MTTQRERVPFKGIEENKAIRAILEGTSSETGQEFFVSLVKNLSKVLNTKAAWITEYLERMSAEGSFRIFDLRNSLRNSSKREKTCAC